MFCKEVDFKDTQIGRLPKAWDVVRLEAVFFELIGGGTPSTAKREYWNGEIPWMTSAHITGSVVTNGQRYITKEGLGNSATHIVPKGNLLVSTRVGIGKAALNMIDIAISQDLTGVVIDRSKVSSQFLYWFIISNVKRLKSLAQGSTIQGILREDLSRMLIPCPSISEQHGIAEVLSCVNLAIQKTSEVIAKTERLAKGLMQKLLTEGIGHKEFKETEMGKTPKTWQITPLKDAVKSYKNGIYKPNQYSGRGYPCIRMYNIVGGHINLINAALLDVTEQELEEFGLEPGDVVVNRVNTSELVGKAGVVPVGFGKATFESKNIRVRLDHSKLSPAFFSVFVQTRTYSNQLLSRAKTAVAQATITQDDLDSVVIPLPPSIDEQERIAEIISAVDKKLVLEKEKKTRLEKIKRGLMDLLLTGKIRVKVD